MLKKKQCNCPSLYSLCSCFGKSKLTFLCDTLDVRPLAVVPRNHRNKEGRIMTLHGQVAIVTGGGSGQGRATALLFAQEGARVVIGDINDKAAAETARLISGQEGGQAVAVKVDVTKVDEVRGMVDTALTHYGRLDILINNAGATQFKGIEDTSEEDWNHIVDTNLKSVFLGCKFAIPAMRKSGGGSIVNI